MNNKLSYHLLKYKHLTELLSIVNESAKLDNQFRNGWKKDWYNISLDISKQLTELDYKIEKIINQNNCPIQFNNVNAKPLKNVKV